MRLLVLTSSFPSAEDDAAGHFVQASALELARHAEVHVVAAGRRFSRTPERRGSLWVHWAGGASLFGWPGAEARLRQAPWRVMGAGGFALGARLHLRRLGRFDRAEAHWMVPCAWPLLGGIDLPLVAHAHGADVRLLVALPSRLRATIVGSLLDRSVRVRFAASSLRDQLVGALAPALARRLELRSSVALPALDLPEASALRAEAARLRCGIGLGRGSDESRPGLVVSVGRLVEPKQVKLALRAMALLEPPARLVVVGDGPERAALEDESRALGLEASFVGLLPRPRALAWLGAADVLLHTASAEAAPSVVREARALGTPVVCCAAGDLAAWAREDRGIIVAAAEPASLAAALGVGLATGPAERSAP
jgi:teichuronic acid biosynthesis glycosyltransferase TuaC